jgi:rhomboid protease GluP
MAFGFTPHFATDFYLDQLSPQQFLALSTGIAGQLGWKVQYVSDAGFIAVTTDKPFKWKAKVTLTILDDKATFRSESIGNEIMDWGKNRKVVGKFTDLFYEQRNSVAPETLTAEYESLKSQIAPPDNDILSAGPGTANRKGGGFWSLFVPRHGYFITPILVDLNIAIFVIMGFSGVDLIHPGSQDLVQWGANVRYYTLEGGWWRLITSCFIHMGIPHLLFNMYALVYIGLLLEPYLGKLRFAVAYLLTGVAASLTSLYMHDLTISVGASGAIFGMYGVFLAMLTTNVVDKAVRRPMMVSIGVFVVYNLVYGMRGNIDNAAHVGGLVSGVLIGYLFCPGLKHRRNSGYVYGGIGLAAIFVLTAGFVVFRETTNDILEYQNKMKAAALMERRALRCVRHLKEDSPKEMWISVIRDSAMRYWDSDIAILHDVENLHLPPLLKKRTSTFIDYCNLQVDRLSYISRQVEANGRVKMDDSLQRYTTRINEVLTSLNENK